MNDMDEARERFSEIRKKGRTRLSGKEFKKASKYLCKAALSPVLGHLKDFLALLHAVLFDRYKVSAEVITAVVASILYLIWVFDVIPDFIPVIGLLDDTVVILTAVRTYAVELEHFRQWKDDHDDR